MLQQFRNQNVYLTRRCHQSRSVVHQCHQVTSRLQRRPARCSAASLRQDCYLFDLDCVVDGLQQLTTHWAFTAANDVFQGSTVPGSPDLYQQHMRQLLSVTRHPYEAVLLLRLLADEGIVGSRSVAGREGPVVGRPVRHSGSRPLLIQEIMEFWEDEVQPACLLRWSRQLGTTTQQLQESVRQAYLQAQQSTPWQVTDIKQQCYGSSSSSSEVLAISRSSNTSSTQATVTSTAAGSSTVAVLPAATCTTQQQQQDTSAAVATALVQPYTAVVQALLCCQQQSIYILSTYPPQVTAAALAAAGLPQPSHSDQAGQRQHHQVLQADDLPRCVELLQQQQQQQRRHPDGISINSNDATFILSSPSKAQLLKDSVWNTACCSTSRSSSSNASSHPGQQQQQQTSFLVGDWVCCSPGLRAKALGASDLDLISEVGLAELLGVSDCDAVMDGVAWRS